MNTSLLTRKPLRSHIRQQRNLLTGQQQADAAEAVKQQLITHHPQLTQSRYIAAYLANDGELDPLPMIEWCWQQGIAVCLPVLHPFTAGHLLFLHYHRETHLVPNRFGIPEPKLSCMDVVPVNWIDTILVPLVAFDSSGNRMGMGGGFYDRTLSQCSEHTSPHLIGLAHQCQHVAKLSVENWDIPMQAIATPNTFLQF